MIDINKISIELKNLLVHSLILPFWYISIFIFNPELYSTNDTILILATCICLTIASALITSAFVVNNEPKESEKKILDKEITFISCTAQVCWFSIFLIISYISKKEFDITFKFYGFVLVYFLPLILLYSMNSNKREKDKIKKKKEK